MYDTLTSEIRELQLVDLNILKDIVKVCDRHNLVYYMIGGTLLGAIRHKGFIPWDDDMDIAMPRRDYELFLNQFSNELPNNLVVDNFKTNVNYKYYITRIENTEYEVNELRDKRRKKPNSHVSIDIFPIDGTPDNKISRSFYYLKILTYRALISLIQKDNIDMARKRSFVEKISILIGTHLPLKQFLSANKLQFKIDKLLQKQNKHSQYAGTIMGAYRTKEVVPRAYFGNGKFYKFESQFFRGPEKYDDYLRHMYGDYWKVPSKQDKKNKRHFKIIK